MSTLKTDFGQKMAEMVCSVNISYRQISTQKDAKSTSRHFVLQPVQGFLKVIITLLKQH
jgi:hypothetical protein